MLILFETPAGYTLWDVKDESVLQDENICQTYPTPSDAQKILHLHSFQPFTKTIESAEAIRALQQSQLHSSLKDFLQENVKNEILHVADSNLARAIKSELNLNVDTQTTKQLPEIFRLIRFHFDSLIPQIEPELHRKLELGVVHEITEKTLKFSPSKIDSMLVHSVHLLDELNKETNNFGMKIREWYGWHFHELLQTTTDNILIAKIILKIGKRSGIDHTDLSDILTEPQIEELTNNAHQSIGTDLADEDLACIQGLCQQVLELNEYRNQIAEYIRVRMRAIAPNLCDIVGEHVGSQLIAHAGSLRNLAKSPSSTVQIMGAEKAYFRAVKENKKTPKYGYIYHAQLVTQSDSSFRGNIARSLSAKGVLSARVDAFF